MYIYIVYVCVCVCVCVPWGDGPQNFSREIADMITIQNTDSVLILNWIVI